MSDVDKHFEATRRLARHQAEREWLDQQYKMLERQSRVLGALDQALDVYYPEKDPTPCQVVKLKVHCGRVIVATCEAIMRHSGLTDLDHSDFGDTPKGDEADAREETVPW